MPSTKPSIRLAPADVALENYTLPAAAHALRIGGNPEDGGDSDGAEKMYCSCNAIKIRLISVAHGGTIGTDKPTNISYLEEIFVSAGCNACGSSFCSCA